MFLKKELNKPKDKIEQLFEEMDDIKTDIQIRYEKKNNSPKKKEDRTKNNIEKLHNMKNIGKLNKKRV